MLRQRLSTHFAPPDRLSRIQILAQIQAYPRPPLLVAMMDAVPNPILILNKQRQAIFANRALHNLLGEDEDEIVGSRPGELLDCIHSAENEAGCGTSEFCRMCGAVNAILNSQKGRDDTQECRITQHDGTSLDLRVTATPFDLNSAAYTMFFVADISHEKRRRALERIFFHDILNTAGGLRNISELLKGASSDQMDDLVSLVHQISEMLIDEIMAQRTLSAAENDELSVSLSILQTRPVIEEIVAVYANREITTARSLLIDPACTELTFSSDRALVKRVLGNMVKNAIEASRPGETVTVGCRSDPAGLRFWIHNPQKMQREVQLQVFQRSFSTKGAGRGLGTYSIKLLTEQYLKGQAGFETSEETGTTFYIILPTNLE